MIKEARVEREVMSYKYASGEKSTQRRHKSGEWWRIKYLGGSDAMNFLRTQIPAGIDQCFPPADHLTRSVHFDDGYLGNAVMMLR
jgi:hypothetical protein